MSKVKIDKKKIKNFLKKIGFTIFKLILPTLLILFILLGCFFPEKPFYSKILLVGLLNLFGSQTSEFVKIFGDQINIVGFILISMGVLLFIRRINKEQSFNQGTLYHNYRYYTYFYASKILNYKSVNLVMISLPIQFKLLINQTFKEISCGDKLPIIENEKIEIIKKNAKRNPKKINLILSDTYKVDENTLPREVKKLPTIHIIRELSGDRVRRYSPKFLEEVRKITSTYGDKVTTINVFAYTNAHHNFRIAKDCFRTGGRTKLEKIVIFQPDRKTFKFKSKGIDISL